MKRELLFFLIVGITAVALDFSSYFLLKYILPVSIAKTLSFLIGSCAAFFLNRKLTFQKNDQIVHRGLRFALLYLSTLIANVMVNHLSLMIWSELYLLAFLFATGTSTILNFLGQKYWVFK